MWKGWPREGSLKSMLLYVLYRRRSINIVRNIIAWEFDLSHSLERILENLLDISTESGIRIFRRSITMERMIRVPRFRTYDKSYRAEVSRTFIHCIRLFTHSLLLYRQAGWTQGAKWTTQPFYMICKTLTV